MFFFQAKFTAQVVFVYAGGGHIVFPFLNDVGGLNMLFVFVGMIVIGISLKTLAFLCILIHAMTDLLSSDSGPALCGSCGLEVEELGILCDKCLQWFHPVCQNMQDDTYHFHTENLNFSCIYTTCGSPNHSVSVTQTPLSSLESVNSFSVLSSDPDLESIDLVSETERGNPSGSPHIATKQAPGLRHAMLKVLNINFRSLNNPQTRDEFHTLLDQTNPDIVIGSET